MLVLMLIVECFEEMAIVALMDVASGRAEEGVEHEPSWRSPGRRLSRTPTPAWPSTVTPTLHAGCARANKPSLATARGAGSAAECEAQK